MVISFVIGRNCFELRTNTNIKKHLEGEVAVGYDDQGAEARYDALGEYLGLGLGLRVRVRVRV